MAAPFADMWDTRTYKAQLFQGLCQGTVGSGDTGWAHSSLVPPQVKEFKMAGGIQGVLESRVHLKQGTRANSSWKDQNY